MAKSKKVMARQLAKEAVEQMAINPLASAERLLAQLSNECDNAIARVNKAVGEEALNAALLRAAESFRKFTGFGHALAMVTGQRRFEQRWNFTARLTPYQERRWLVLKHGGSLPVTVEMPGKEILEALRAQQPAGASRIFEGEHEWQEHLSKQGLEEARGVVGETAFERRARYGSE